MDMNYIDLGFDLNRHIGFDFDHYDASRLPKLSPEDEEKWYSKFYYRGRTEVPESLTECIQPGVYMDPKDAILPGKKGGIDKMLEPGQIPGDNGYCLLPNGCGYSSIRCELPGITTDMINWHKRYRMADKLAYMIWYPGSHDNEVGGMTQEDLGFGMSRLDVKVPASIKNLGFSRHPAEVDPLYEGIVGGGGEWTNLEYPEIAPLIITSFHYMRRLPDDSGLEFRTHHYVGMFIIDGEPVVEQLLEPEVTVEIARRLADHCIYERANLVTFLPELYEKMKDEPLPPLEGAETIWTLSTESTPDADA